MKKSTKKTMLAFALTFVLLAVFLPVFPAMAADYTATLMGQLDADVSTSVDEWGLGDLPSASVSFSLGAEATIVMEFDEPIKFTGNWTGISTDIPVADDAEAEAFLGGIISFKVDGVELGSREVPMVNRDGGGFLTIDVARQWGGNYDAYDLAGMAPFSKLEITFLLGDEVNFDADGGSAAPPAAVTGGYAWIGGTFLTEEGDFDWVPFEDQKVAFELGVPFTVTLDFGSGTNTHGEASWGYITVVQTDMMASASEFSAYIDSIIVDGRSINFYEENIEVGFDGGVRISLTNAWSDDPVVASPAIIGEFSKMEVTMAFMASDADAPIFPAAPPPVDVDPEPGADTDNVAGRDDTAALEIAPDVSFREEPDSGGLPGWLIALIIAGGAVIIAVVVVVVMKGKKK
ncbi:MAG: hypothetical protein FWG72_02325 [Oscillospiraceae bacterium]|nr:hypothetical protein [Oscillospiraceae bacterium]